MSVSFEVSGSGEAVVLLHGSMASKEQWRMLARELTPRYKVITMDLKGYGKTPPPEDQDNYMLKDESDMLVSILDRTLPQDENYHILGHSYGGAVALHHAYHHRRRVASLTAIEPMAYHLLPESHEVLSISQQMINDIRSDIQRGESDKGARKFIDLWMRPGTFDNLADREKKVLSEGVKKMVIDFRAAANDPLTINEYADLPMPVCLIAGKDSPPYSLSISRVVAQAIPNICLHWVDGGHFAPFTHGHQVTPIILDFLEKST